MSNALKESVQVGSCREDVVNKDAKKKQTIEKMTKIEPLTLVQLPLCRIQKHMSHCDLKFLEFYAL